MKKNTMMRIASFLLIAVLLSTSAISGTYAKYVTADTATDSARVAKWGVTVTATDDSMFKNQYTTSVAWAGDDGVSVMSTEKVVAPGTTGSLVDFTVAGTPEVDVEVTYTPVLTLENWTADSDEYCPIIFNVNDKLFYIGADGITSVTELITAVQNAITGSTAKYNAGTNLSGVVADDLAVSWLWEFEGQIPGAKNADDQNNEKDTTLGNWEKNGKPAPSISLNITCTITQID